MIPSHLTLPSAEVLNAIKASIPFVPTLALLLGGCATVSGGDITSEIKSVTINDVPGAEVYGIHVWRSEGAYVLTGSLARFGSVMAERGHIHVEAAEPAQKMKIIGAAFPTRGFRHAKTQRHSQFRVTLAEPVPKNATIFVKYHRGFHR